MSIFGDIVTGAASVGAGYLASQGTKKATNQAVKGLNSGISELDENRDYVAGLYSPYTTTGGNALARIGALSGAEGAQAQQDAFGQYVESPEVAFSRDQGIQAIDRSANARGGLMSGRTLTDLNKFGQGVAMQGYGDYYNRLASLAGMGLGATGSVADNATRTSFGIADLFRDKGIAKASGTVGKTNAYTNMIQNGADTFASVDESIGAAFNPLAKIGMSSYGG